MAFLTDNLTGSAGNLVSHTADSGESWTHLTTTSQAQLSGSGTVYGVTAAGLYDVFSSSNTPSSADYIVRMTMTNLSVLGAGQIGVIGRLTGTTPTTFVGYLLRHNQSGGGKLELYAMTSGGGFTALGGVYSYTPTTGDNVDLVCNGSSISVKVNGTTVIGPVTNTNQTAAGVPAIWTADGAQTATTGIHLDSVKTLSVSSVPTAYTLTGPSAGRPSVASSNFTVTLNSAATSTVTITPSDSSGGGTFTPASVSITSGNTTGTFTYTAASTGAKTIGTTDDAGLSDPSSLTFTAYSLTVSPGSQSVGNSVAASLTATLTPSGPLSASTTAGTLSTASPTSGTGFTLTTPSSGSGTATVTVTGLGGTSQTATVSYAPAAATALTLTGPSAVPVGSASSNFTIAANGSLASSVTVTVTVTPSGGTITSTPVTLASGVGSTGTFTYTAATAGTFTVAITNGSGLTNPSSLSITATEVSTLNFLFPAGVSGLSSVGFTLVDLATDTQYQAFTTTGVTEPIAGSGVYVANVSLPKTLHVACLWSLVPGGVTKYINEFLPRS